MCSNSFNSWSRLERVTIFAVLRYALNILRQRQAASRGSLSLTECKHV